MPPRKLVSNIISIDRAADPPEPQGPTPVSARGIKKSIPNHYTRKNALRRFFLLGSGVWKVQRETGVPTAELEDDLRKLAWAEWERQNGRAA